MQENTKKYIKHQLWEIEVMLNNITDNLYTMRKAIRRLNTLMKKGIDKKIPQ